MLNRGLCVVVLAWVCLLKASLGQELAVLDDYPPMVDQCVIDTGATEEDAEIPFDSRLVPETDTAKCLMACVYKNIGVINEDGTENPLGLTHMVETLYVGLPSYDNALSAAQDCSGMPEQDGECELAATIRGCVAEANSRYDVILSAWKPQ